MDRKLVALLASGLVIMLFTTWLALPGPPPSINVEDRKFMHCPKCNKEMPYIASRFEKGCPHCGYEGELVATKLSLAKTGPPPSPVAKVLSPLFIEGNVLIALIIWYFLRKRKRAKEVEHLYIDCDRCHQRLRYPADKVGQIGVCPRCKRRFLYPEAAPDENNETPIPWWKPAHWLKILRRRGSQFKKSG